MGHGKRVRVTLGVNVSRVAGRSEGLEVAAVRGAVGDEVGFVVANALGIDVGVVSCLENGSTIGCILAGFGNLSFRCFIN